MRVYEDCHNICKTLRKHRLWVAINFEWGKRISSGLWVGLSGIILAFVQRCSKRERNKEY